MSQTIYKIDKGVPLARRSYCEVYPFDKMEKDDSIFIEEAKKYEARRHLSIWMHRFGREKAFITAKVEGGIRIWRTR